MLSTDFYNSSLGIGLTIGGIAVIFVFYLFKRAQQSSKR
jgi:hypothetical protein